MTVALVEKYEELWEDAKAAEGCRRNHPDPYSAHRRTALAPSRLSASRRSGRASVGISHSAAVQAARADYEGGPGDRIRSPRSVVGTAIAH